MADKLKAEADAFFRAKKFTDAIEKYTAAIDTSKVVDAVTAATAAAAAAATTDDAATTDADNDNTKKRNTDTSRCYSNRAACREKLVNHSYGSEKTTLINQGLADGRACVKLDPDFVRGYQRLTTFLLLSLDDTFDDWKKPGDYNSDSDDEDDDDDNKMNIDDNDTTTSNKKNNGNNNNKKYDKDASLVRVTKVRRELEKVSRRGLVLDPANEALLEALQVLRDLDPSSSSKGSSKKSFDMNLNLKPTDIELSLSEGASERSKFHKTAGAKAFQNKNWILAEKLYTKALACDPVSVKVVITAADANAIPMGEGHATAVLYSNRSATRSSQENYSLALQDANICLTLRPDWSKGQSRRSTALFGLGRYGDAEAACVAGLVLESTSLPLQTMLETCQKETCESLEVQKEMFRLRTQAKQDVKLQELMKQFSGGGPGGPKVFNTNNMDFSGGGNPFANMGMGGNGGGSNGLEGLFGGQSKKPKLSDSQMRGMARATVANGGKRDTNNNNNNSDIPFMPPPAASTTTTPSASAAVGKVEGEEEVLTDDDDDDDEDGVAVKSIIE